MVADVNFAVKKRDTFGADVNLRKPGKSDFIELSGRHVTPS